eukprot:1338779-Amorphochlora_amoeboformis.AAC.2
MINEPRNPTNLNTSHRFQSHMPGDSIESRGVLGIHGFASGCPQIWMMVDVCHCESRVGYLGCFLGLITPMHGKEAKSQQRRLTTNTFCPNLSF